MLKAAQSSLNSGIVCLPYFSIVPLLIRHFVVGRASHPDMPEQLASGQPVYAPSAIAAKGGKFRQLPGQPGYVTVSSVSSSPC